MECPYCRTRLEPAVAECPACRVTFPRAAALLGALPRMNSGISDDSGLLQSGTGKLQSAIRGLREKFPQLVVQIVVRAFPQDHPLGLYAFWIFNAASFSGNSHRGTDNHTVLVVLDPQRQESALVLGYGLEAKVETAVLEHLQELSGPAWSAGRWVDGLLVLLEGLDRLFESVAEVEDHEALAGEY